jgi:hypothetical protein
LRFDPPIDPFAECGENRKRMQLQNFALTLRCGGDHNFEEGSRLIIRQRNSPPNSLARCRMPPIPDAHFLRTQFRNALINSLAIVEHRDDDAPVSLVQVDPDLPSLRRAGTRWSGPLARCGRPRFRLPCRAAGNPGGTSKKVSNATSLGQTLRIPASADSNPTSSSSGGCKR